MSNIIKSIRLCACLLACLISNSALAQWQGQWDTSYGAVKLQQNQAFVFGDYGTWGTIEGVLSNDRQLFRGVFRRNDNGDVGYIEWKLSRSGAFVGRWVRRGNALPSWDRTGTAWNGSRTSAARPQLTVYRGNSQIGAFLSRQSTTYVNWIGRLANAPADDPYSHGLEHRIDLTPAKIATAFEMQRHVRAVSQKGDLRVSGEERAAQAYDRMAGWELLGQGIISDGGLRNSLLRAAVAKRGNAIVVAFRGTKGDNLADTFTAGVMLDGNIRRVQPSFIRSDMRGDVLVHAGFQRSYLRLRSQVLAALDGQRDVHLFITGHSLGGAIAALMAYDMGVNRPNQFRSITSITSGAPRVGNPSFARSFERYVPDNLRVVVNRDPVPNVPYLNGRYQHAGRLLVIARGSGDLVPHDDMDVHANIIQFGYHNNTEYFDAVKLLAQHAPRTNRLSPTGNSWSRAAARREIALAAEPRIGRGNLRNRLRRRNNE